MLKDQRGIISPHFLIILAALGVVVYLLATTLLPIKDDFFKALYPKPSSKALESQSGFSRYGIQIDLQSPNKIPNALEIQTITPAWVRFVYRPTVPIPSFSSTVNKLVIFNNESAEPAPIGNTDVNTWKAYTDNTYLPKLQGMLSSNTNITAIEIWNEEDVCPNTYFCPGVPAQAYAYMLKKAASVIKTYNPDIKVIMGGLVSGNLSYVTNVRYAEANVFAQVDAIGLHPYGKSPNGWCAKGTSPGCNGNELPFGDLVTSVTDYKNTSSLSVWVTEIGQGTDDRIWQAEYLRRAFNVLSQEELQVNVVNWYAWTDLMTGGNSNNWGLYDSSGVLKPSGEAFSSFTKIISPSPSLTPTPGGDNIPPQVSITNPLDSGTVSRRSTVNIEAAATDNTQVAKVEFYVNGSLKCTDTTLSYSCPWKVPNKPNASYTLLTKAYDQAGNTNSSTITVTSR